MSRPSVESAPIEPTPYELYIRLNQLTALWPEAPGRWVGEVVAACGFQAAELTLRLMEDALGDKRSEAFPEERVARYAEHLVKGVETTCCLLREVGAPPPAVCASRGESGTTVASPGLAVLTRLDREQLDAISGRLLLATAGLHFDVGIEEQLRTARREKGLCTLSDERPGETTVMNYQCVVSPEAVRGLSERTPFGPEDHLFSTAHQITECWLKIALHYLDETRVLAERGRWSAAADVLAHACAVLPLAIQAGQLLDQMVLVDYHPLRVRLRDGSGAQSQAARALGPAIHAAAAALWTALERDDLRVLDVLQRPNEHLEPYRYLTRLKSAGKLLQSFLFHHYTLVLGVLGTHSVGSLGYEMRELADRAVQPIFPETNQAHHDYVMLTNFEHGHSSGSIVYQNELNHGWNPYLVSEQPRECPRQVVEARVQAYFQAIEDRDAEAWVNLFEPLRGQLHDVPGTRPYFGQRRLNVFINGMFRAFREMRATCSPPRIDGNAASVDWHFDAVSYHGVSTVLDGREEFLFDDEGFILKAVADWQPAVVASQWQAEARAEPADARAPRPESYVASLAPEARQVSALKNARG
jgi:HEPN domain-containing protein